MLRIVLLSNLLLLPLIEIRAQVNLQKFILEDLSFIYTSNRSENRCLTWLKLENKRPSLQYADDGSLFIKAVIGARIEKEPCRFQFSNEMRVLKEARAEKENGDVVRIVYFEAHVTPPLTTIIATIEDYSDRLIFEAPYRRSNNYSIFDFMQKSYISFDFSGITLTTDNPQTSFKKNHVFPIAGGTLAIPLHFQWIYGSFGMYQNLANLSKGNKADVRYTEFLLNLRYVYVGPKPIGRPELHAVGELKNRNIFQLSDEKPYVIGSNISSGFGFYFNWYPFAIFRSWISYLARLGVHIEGRYFLPIEDFKSWDVEGGINFRLTPKYTLGTFLKYTHQNGINNLGVVNENILIYGLRLRVQSGLGEDL